MKKYFLMAVLVMAGVCGFAQESAEEVVSTGTELAVTADGKKVTMWDFKMDDASGDVSFVISVDGAKAGDLWSWCRMWLAENVKEYNRIKQIEDKTEGRLVVNYTAAVNVQANDGQFESRWRGTQTWKMTIQCKDERFRVRMTEYTSQWDAQPLLMGQWAKPLEQINRSKEEAAKRMGEEIFNKQYNEVVAIVVASMGEYMKKMHDEDDDF